MKRNLVIVCLVVLFVALMAGFYLLGDKKGTVKVFSELQDERFGSIYVLGRHDGFLNGWDVAFLHRDNKNNRLAYYLAHESRGWKSANLQFDGKFITVYKANTIVAVYDTKISTFTHRLQGVTYSKKDAVIENHHAAFWNLAGIQNRK